MSLRSSARLLAASAAFALVVAACSSSGDPSDQAFQPPDHSADAAAISEADTDAALPDVEPDGPVGTYGFSRYVWTEADGNVLPTLIEGPRGEQVRCQDEDLPCSYLDLKELLDSGDPIPSELSMSEAELEELVGQLDLLNAKLATYESPDDVCADGYTTASTQNPNMGIHMTNAGNIFDGFVVDEPAIVLMAIEGGETLPRSEVGDCVDGRWTGDPDYQVVGAAYLVPPSEEHPEGFAGDIDNWHIHHDTCAGAEREDRAIADPAACEEEGGQFMEVMPTWMMHAYVVPGFDSQQGVFSMWNGSVWPLVDSADLREIRTQADFPGGVLTPINNFSFETVRIEAGEDVVWANSDSVPHTVTSGTPSSPASLFDSGALGTGRTFEASFDEPGRYNYYCTLHPQMTGTVIVED